MNKQGHVSSEWSTKSQYQEQRQIPSPACQIFQTFEICYSTNAESLEQRCILSDYLFYDKVVVVKSGHAQTDNNIWINSF